MLVVIYNRLRCVIRSQRILGQLTYASIALGLILLECLFEVGNPFSFQLSIEVSNVDTSSSFEVYDDVHIFFIKASFDISDHNPAIKGFLDFLDSLNASLTVTVDLESVF